MDRIKVHDELRVEILQETTSFGLKMEIEEFLEAPDIDEIVNMQYSSSASQYGSIYSVMIFYTIKSEGKTGLEDL